MDARGPYGDTACLRAGSVLFDCSRVRVDNQDEAEVRLSSPRAELFDSPLRVEVV